jgi:hypothetical protein
VIEYELTWFEMVGHWWHWQQAFWQHWDKPGKNSLPRARLYKLCGKGLEELDEYHVSTILEGRAKAITCGVVVDWLALLCLTSCAL